MSFFVCGARSVCKKYQMNAAKINKCATLIHHFWKVMSVMKWGKKGRKKGTNSTFVSEIIFNAPHTACHIQKCFRYLSREWPTICLNAHISTQCYRVQNVRTSVK